MNSRQHENCDRALVPRPSTRQIVLARIERRPARLDLTAYPWLPGTEVRMTRAADYAALAQEQAA